MKPLLIVPPAPARWPALAALLAQTHRPWIDNIEQRLTRGVANAEDAYAVIQDGGQFLACAAINKRGSYGVLGHVFTRPDQRGRGHARQLTETVLSWFEMTGGRWLFLGTTAEMDESLYQKFGFAPVQRTSWAPFDRVSMLRLSPGATPTPLADAAGTIQIRPLARADWPLMVGLLQFRPGPDPRVPLSESAVSAEVFTLDLLDHLERDACVLLGAFQGEHLIAMATLAIDAPPPRTFGIVVPHDNPPAELRQALQTAAQARGYTQVNFPMETLAAAGHHDGS